jgi:hypothetical protein
MSGPGYRVPPNYPETPMSSNMSHSAHPLNNANYYGHVRTTSAASSVDYHSAPPPPPPPRSRGDVTHQGVQNGQIGGGFGPYAVSCAPTLMKTATVRCTSLSTFAHHIPLSRRYRKTPFQPTETAMAGSVQAIQVAPPTPMRKRSPQALRNRQIQ